MNASVGKRKDSEWNGARITIGNTVVPDPLFYAVPCCRRTKRTVHTDHIALAKKRWVIGCGRERDRWWNAATTPQGFVGLRECRMYARRYQKKRNEFGVEMMIHRGKVKRLTWHR